MGKTLIRLYGVAEHGNGEVDHVGGIAKVSDRDAIAGVRAFENASEITDFLKVHFQYKTSPDYHIVEITESLIADVKSSIKNKVYKTIEGSSSWQACVFKPGHTTFQASPRLCICQQCKVDYGSCSLFKEYEIQMQTLIEKVLRSDPPPPTTDFGEEDVNDFICPSTVVAVRLTLQRTISGSFSWRKWML